jgi:VWFA-related protein
MRQHVHQIGLRRLYAISFIFFCLIACASAGLGQEKDPTDVIKVNTDLVVFDVQVIDKKTKTVLTDLTEADFEIFDRGTKQTVSYFSHDELPLSIMLLLDVSDSVRPFIRRIRDGALEALRHLKAEDQVAVMAFATTPELVQDFTVDRNLVATQIEAATSDDKLGVKTGFAAAMDDAAVRMLNAPPGNRSVIIVITDNFFFTSPYQEQIILADLFQSGSVVYGLLVNTSNPYTSLNGSYHPGVDRYVEKTGGELVYANNKEVAGKLALLIDHLRLRYAVGFRPTDNSDDNKFRSVEIKIANNQRKDKKAVVVLTRGGYYFRRRSS